VVSGGLISVQKKHANTATTHYNSGFFITTNIYPDFGGGRDAEAIRKRLSVFETSPLPSKDPGISGKLLYFIQREYGGVTIKHKTSSIALYVKKMIV